MDDVLQGALRATRSDLGDTELLARALRLCEHSGHPVPVDLEDRRVCPARTFESERRFLVGAELPDGTWLREAETPRVEIPEHRVFWVTPQPVSLSKPLVAELLEQEVPGLTFGRSRKVAQLAPRLQGLPLRRLSIASTGSGDDALEALPALPLLSEIDLSGCKAITRAGLGHLAERAPGLMRLTFDNARKLELDDLDRFASLSRLSLSRAGLPLKRIKAMPVLSGLTHLNLYGCPMTAKSLAALAPKLPDLRQLVCAPKGHHWDNAFLEGLGVFPELHALTVPGVYGGHPEDPASVEALRGLSQLRHLDIDLSYVDSPGALSSLHLLKTLVLGRPSDEAVLAALELPQLQTLVLRGCRRVSGEVLERAAARPWLNFEIGGFWWVNDSEAENARRRHEGLVAVSQTPARTLYLAPVGLNKVPNPEGLIDPEFPSAGRVVQASLPRPAAEPPATRGSTPWVTY